jgi:glycosyltransferase involved in cell wall biosynthesis
MGNQMAIRAPDAGRALPDRGAEGLRIALFSGNYNITRDGANKALNRLVGHLLERGAAVRIYAPTVPRPAFAPTGELVSVPSLPIPGRREYRLASGLTPRIRADIRAFAPTHFHLSAPDLLGTSAQKFAHELGVPAVASFHTRFETYFRYYGLQFLSSAVARHLRSFYADSDVVLAPNDPIAEELRREGLGDRVRIWGRGVDDAFSPDRRDLAWRRLHGYGDDEAVVMFFGRIVREKGVDTFVAAMRDLAARGRSLRPLIVGDGPARPWLAARLPDAVFTGHLEGEDLARAVASADILVNPSETEAFGNVNLEAMAAGVAVVSADVGSARALIAPGRTGLLVPPRAPGAYAEAVEALVKAPRRRRRLGLAAAAAAAAYSWPDILDAVLEIYRATFF